MKIKNKIYSSDLTLMMYVSIILSIGLLIFALYKYFYLLQNAVLFFISAFIFLLFFLIVVSFIQAKIMDFNSEFHIKYINLLPDKIYFAFTDPACDFECPYSEVEEFIFNVNVINREISYNNPSPIPYSFIDGVSLTFLLLNNRKIELIANNASSLRFLRSLIDHTRMIKKVSYNLPPSLSNQGLKEKIDNYLNDGRKQCVTSKQKNWCKSLSILFFSFTIFGFMYVIIRSPQNPDFYVRNSVLWIFLPMIFSFVFDILLIIDNLFEKRALKYNRLLEKEFYLNNSFNISLLLIKIITGGYILYSIYNDFL